MHELIATWGKHVFTVGLPDTVFCDFPGVYIFAGSKAEGEWVAEYIASTESLQHSLFQHCLWDKAVRRSATHVHVMAVTTASEGQSVAHSLIDEFEPWLNSPGG